MPPRFIGEFEQMTLLAIMRLRGGAHAVAILDELDERAGRAVSRRTLYTTLERLERKGLLEWKTEDGPPERGGHPRRLFTVTPAGIAALQDSRNALTRLWEGLESILEGER